MDGFPQLSAKDQETNFPITIELREFRFMLNVFGSLFL